MDQAREEPGTGPEERDWSAPVFKTDRNEEIIPSYNHTWGRRRFRSVRYRTTGSGRFDFWW